MNNLYALSVVESSKTSEGIAKISEFLRSFLYECNETEIELHKEVSLIENFIELEKLRHDKQLKISFEITGDLGARKIAPMILFTFVENCFKHGVRGGIKNPYITINLSATAHGISFYSENSVLINSENFTQKSGGIGLVNVKKRLDLIYGNRYKLHYKKNHDIFSVELIINNSE